MCSRQRNEPLMWRQRENQRIALERNNISGAALAPRNFKTACAPPCNIPRYYGSSLISYSANNEKCHARLARLTVSGRCCNKCAQFGHIKNTSDKIQHKNADENIALCLVSRKLTLHFVANCKNLCFLASKHGIIFVEYTQKKNIN